MSVVRRDVVFDAPVGFRPLALDLYVPPAPSVVCLYLHGGGWRLGSRRTGPGAAARWMSPSFFEYLAEQGVAVASVDYRLSGEARFPAQLEDARAAVTFLGGHRDDFGLPAALAVWGVSAGGQLAALLALDPGSDALPVRSAVCWYTPTDLDALADDIVEAGGTPDRSATSREGLLVGGPLDERRHLLASASPVTAVDGAGEPPPFLFLHGAADLAVPPRQSTRLAEALTAAGGSATVELVAGATHMFPELDDEATRSVVDRSVRFMLDPADLFDPTGA